MRDATAGTRCAWTGLTAQDVMQAQVVTVSPTAPLSEVERLLSEHRISGMPVVDSSGRCVGVVSFRDLLGRSAERPHSRTSSDRGLLRNTQDGFGAEDLRSRSVPEGSSATVADAMTPVLVDVSTTATVEEICRTMARHSVHRVLVTDAATGRMVGIVSSLGVLAAIAGEPTARAAEIGRAHV